MRTRKITLHLPAALLERAERMAESERVPLNDILVDMIALGLFDLEESDQYENAHYH